MLLNVLAEVNLYERWDGEMGNLIVSLSAFFSSVPRPPNKQINKQNKTLGWPVETLNLFIILLRKSGIEHVSSLKGSPGHTVQCQDWVQNLEGRKQRQEKEPSLFEPSSSRLRIWSPGSHL